MAGVFWDDEYHPKIGLDRLATDERLRLADVRDIAESLARLGREGLLAVGK